MNVHSLLSLSPCITRTNNDLCTQIMLHRTNKTKNSLNDVLRAAEKNDSGKRITKMERNDGKMACKCDNHYELTAVVITMNDA